MEEFNTNLWNWDYIRQQQMQAQYHQDQMNRVFDCTKKLKDFLDSMDKIDPAYRSMATAQMCAVLMDHANRQQHF